MLKYILATLLLAAVGAFGQMEIRSTDLYDADNFRAAAPAVGTRAADLTFADLDGRMWSLASFRGKVLVLMKGGYT